MTAYKPGITPAADRLHAKRYVEIGPGQIAEVIRPERKFRQDGLVIMPIANGADPGGYYTQWIPARSARDADLADWVHVEPGNYVRKARVWDQIVSPSTGGKP